MAVSFPTQYKKYSLSKQGYWMGLILTTPFIQNLDPAGMKFRFETPEAFSVIQVWTLTKPFQNLNFFYFFLAKKLDVSLGT